MYGDRERIVLCSVIMCILELLYPHMVHVIKTTTRFQFMSWNVQNDDVLGELTIVLQRTALIPRQYNKKRRLLCDGFMLSASHRRASRRLRKMLPLFFRL